MCLKLQQCQVQPPGPVSAGLFAWNARKADRPREAQRLEQVAPHQGGRVPGGRVKRAFAAGLIWKQRQPPPPPPSPRPQVSWWCRGVRSPAGHLNDKGAAAGWEGAGGVVRSGPTRSQPRSCPAKPPPRGPKIWGEGARTRAWALSCVCSGVGGRGATQGGRAGARDKGPDLTDPAGGEGGRWSVGE